MILRPVLFLAAAFALIGLFPAFASAQCGSNYCKGKIAKIYVNSSASTYISVAGGGVPQNCDLHAKSYLILYKSSDNYDALYALILSSYNTGKGLHFRTAPVSASNRTCRIEYVTTL